MFGPQVSAIWYDETGIEALKKEEVCMIYRCSLLLLPKFGSVIVRQGRKKTSVNDIMETRRVKLMMNNSFICELSSMW